MASVRGLARVIVSFGLIFMIPTGCKSTGDQQSDSETLSAPGSQTAEKFSTVPSDRFNTLSQQQNAEFFGCLCVEDQGKWSGWQFLKNGSKGYKTEIANSAHADIELCIAAREQLPKCGG